MATLRVAHLEVVMFTDHRRLSVVHRVWWKSMRELRTDNKCRLNAWQAELDSCKTKMELHDVIGLHDKTAHARVVRWWFIVSEAAVSYSQRHQDYQHRIKGSQSHSDNWHHCYKAKSQTLVLSIHPIFKSLLAKSPASTNWHRPIFKSLSANNLASTNLHRPMPNWTFTLRP